MLFLISYKFSDANAQEKGAKMLTEWYDKGGPQNRPEGYDVKSRIFLPQHGNDYSVVNGGFFIIFSLIYIENIFNRILGVSVDSLLV